MVRPKKRCTQCGCEKDYAAFLTGSKICRRCSGHYKQRAESFDARLRIAKSVPKDLETALDLPNGRVLKLARIGGEVVISAGWARRRHYTTALQPQSLVRLPATKAADLAKLLDGLAVGP